jgi:hypothetical protein
LKEVDILVCMELGHFMASSWFCALGKGVSKLLYT